MLVRWLALALALASRPLSAARLDDVTCGVVGDSCRKSDDCCMWLGCRDGDWAVPSEQYTCVHIDPPPSEMDYVEKVAARYMEYLPEMLEEQGFIDYLLKKWKGKEERLIHNLRRRFPPRKDEL